MNQRELKTMRDAFTRAEKLESQQTNDPGYWKWVIQKAEDDIAEALKQIERLEREQEAGDLPNEPF